jgi:hypothetical protein
VVTILLKRGANPSILTEVIISSYLSYFLQEGQTAIDLAREQKKYSTVAILERFLNPPLPPAPAPLPPAPAPLPPPRDEEKERLVQFLDILVVIIFVGKFFEECQ